MVVEPTSRQQPRTKADESATTTVRLTEVFLSLQGETSRAGLPTVFIRLAGCPLRCRWCDTPYSFQAGETVTLDSLLARVAGYGVPVVCVTGGEPLAQKNCLPLLIALCDTGYSVSLETSGALDVGQVDPRVSRIVDIKPPASGEAEGQRGPGVGGLPYGPGAGCLAVAAVRRADGGRPGQAGARPGNGRSGRGQSEDGKEPAPGHGAILAVRQARGVP